MRFSSSFSKFAVIAVLATVVSTVVATDAGGLRGFSEDTGLERQDCAKLKKKKDCPKLIQIDAGSNGNRATVYQFKKDKYGNIKTFRQIGGKEEGEKQPLAESETAVQDILTLLEKQKDNLGLKPKETCVFLSATAGVRETDYENYDEVIREVRSAVVDAKYVVLEQEEWIRVISGNEEGAKAWLAKNYDGGNWDKATEKTDGIIEVRLIYSLLLTMLL